MVEFGCTPIGIYDSLSILRSERDPIFLNQSSYLDGQIDCSSGSDECGHQTAASGFLKLRSRDAVIKSWAMVFFCLTHCRLESRTVYSFFTEPESLE